MLCKVLIKTYCLFYSFDLSIVSISHKTYIRKEGIGCCPPTLFIKNLTYATATFCYDSLVIVVGDLQASVGRGHLIITSPFHIPTETAKNEILTKALKQESQCTKKRKKGKITRCRKKRSSNNSHTRCLKQSLRVTD